MTLRVQSNFRKIWPGDNMVIDVELIHPIARRTKCHSLSVRVVLLVRIMVTESKQFVIPRKNNYSSIQEPWGSFQSEWYQWNREQMEWLLGYKIYFELQSNWSIKQWWGYRWNDDHLKTCFEGWIESVTILMNDDMVRRIFKIIRMDCLKSIHRMCMEQWGLFDRFLVFDNSRTSWIFIFLMSDEVIITFAYDDTLAWWV